MIWAEVIFIWVWDWSLLSGEGNVHSEFLISISQTFSCAIPSPIILNRAANHVWYNSLYSTEQSYRKIPETSISLIIHPIYCWSTRFRMLVSISLYLTFNFEIIISIWLQTYMHGYTNEQKTDITQAFPSTEPCSSKHFTDWIWTSLPLKLVIKLDDLKVNHKICWLKINSLIVTANPGWPLQIRN